MGNYALTLRWLRCPDGAEIAPHPWVNGTIVRWPENREWVRAPDGGKMIATDGVSYGPKVRFCSDRREVYRRRLEAPDELIVTEYLKVADGEDVPGGVDYAGLVRFVSEYGFPAAARPMEQVVSASEFARGKAAGHYDQDDTIITVPGPEPQNEMDVVSLAAEIPSGIREIWDAYERRDIVEVADLFREQQEWDTSALHPDMQIINGALTLTLPVYTLLGFMMMETALVVTGGTQVMRCENCAVMFVTGAGTGRRSTAKYCSNRCRVAAQRAEKGEQS